MKKNKKEIKRREKVGSKIDFKNVPVPIDIYNQLEAMRRTAILFSKHAVITGLINGTVKAEKKVMKGGKNERKIK